MSKAEGVEFTIIATSNGKEIAGRLNFFASDIQDFTENEEGMYEYAERVFDEVETHGCD